MFDGSEFRRLEGIFKFRYPVSFLESLGRFEELAMTPAFCTLFRRWAMCAESDVRNARRNGVPNELIPFFIEPQETQTDYYCFDTVDDSVVVYADHAIVFRWSSYAEYMDWIETRIGFGAGQRAG